ncbi:MAG: translation initiation factor IF-1 [Pedosphaera sp. Tous-C6FEB]|nr:MAG: translation initiation factor IF-1 [Pedosphaera sp. Tous-C6FEB]
MSGKFAFSVEGLIVEALPRGLFRVELANGHQVLGHVLRRQAPLVERVKVGAMVTVKMSPGDLSHGLVDLNESKL